MRVVQVFRNRNPIFFSIERVFEIIHTPLCSYLPVETVKLPFRGVKVKNISCLRKIKAVSSKEQLFHVTGDVHYVVFALPRNRTILTIHDCVFMEHYTGIKKWLLKKILLDWPLRYTKYITTISEKTKEEIINITGCPADKIRVIPNPVAQQIRFSPKTFNQQKPVLLFLGSTFNKNLDRVIPALAGISCLLHIIGKPSAGQVEAIKANAIDHQIESGITDEELANRYTAADIILFPSLYEGFGLPVLEGFRAGRVVLTSNITPMNQVAGGAAHLVNPLDAESIRQGVLQLINDAPYREQLIDKGFKVAEKYSPEQIARQYFDLYTEVFKNSCAE